MYVVGGIVTEVVVRRWDWVIRGLDKVLYVVYMYVICVFVRNLGF